MLRVRTSFQDTPGDRYYFVLYYNDRPLQEQLGDLCLKDGDTVLLREPHRRSPKQKGRRWMPSSASWPYATATSAELSLAARFCGYMATVVRPNAYYRRRLPTA